MSEETIATIDPYIPGQYTKKVRDPNMRDAVQNYLDSDLPTGVKTGYAELDALMRVDKGYIFTITGIPSHGKSEFLDQLMVRWAINSGWKFLLFSPENHPIMYHVDKIASKYAACPFKAEAQWAHQQTEAEREESIDFVDDHFAWLEMPEDKRTLTAIFSEVKFAKEYYGIDCFVIDPWNEISDPRAGGLSETEHIGNQLRKIKNFAQINNILVAIVAHPTKMQKQHGKEVYVKPKLFDINGSANWANKSDFALSVYRADIGQANSRVEIDILKVKFKNYGQAGNMCSFTYNNESGGIFEPAEAQLYANAP